MVTRDKRLTDKQLRALTAFLESDPNVRLAWLFGSQTRSATGPLSDVDVALFLERCGDAAGLRADRIRYATAVARVLDRDDVDLVLLNGAPPLLRHRVLEQGQMLVCRDESARIRFQVATVRDYCDLAPLWRVSRTYLRQNLRLEFGRG